MTMFVLVPTPGDVPPASEIGGKALGLARLATVPDVLVSPWFVIRTSAFDTFGRASATAEAAARSLPSALADELRTALDACGLYGARVAVRSSATAEDAAAASFAGQFRSVLGVHAGDDLQELWTAINQVWQSAFSAHAIAYAQVTPAPISMAVIVQRLAPARAAGVAFSVDPVTGDGDVAIVSAVYGLGEMLVSGESDADTFRVRFSGDAVAETVTTAAHKECALERDGRPDAMHGTRRVAVPEALRDITAISSGQAVVIARVARRLEHALGAPQDIEWAMGDAGARAGISNPQAGDVLYILQTRPVTAIGPAGAGADGNGVRSSDARTRDGRTGERRVWDNSNIVESYGGVTTPLTFSFARGVYEQVYRQFCDVLGVRASVIDAHQDTFANMLGLIRGRVYYNLLNWYRVLALLPGYSVNREFMERMMGVRERLDAPPPQAAAGERRRDAVRLLHSVRRLWSEHRHLDLEIASFHARVNRALAPIEGVDLDLWAADDLVRLYQRLDRELLLHWRAPLVNDFFAMIWFGVLGKLVERWLPAAEPTLVNDLMVGEGNIVSTEPARRIMALASLVANDSALHAAFTNEPDDDALLNAVRKSGTHAVFLREFDLYLARFGDRCIGELKLETITPSENPGYVIRMVRAYVEQGQTDAARGAEGEGEIRKRAEVVVRSSLRGVRKRAMFLVLRHARSRVRDRENLRFERTRVFGAVRRIFRGLGLRLHERGRLAGARDVFYLTVDELFAAVAGTGITHDLAPVATFRQQEFVRYANAPAPPDRFETWGPPDAPAADTAAATASATGQDGLAEGFQGLGCCPGVVRAPVRVVRDPGHAGNLRGHILVAERTDPGWTLLFPTVSGLLVQRGSLLSHSAIVAREIGLPCVVAIPDLMNRLQDGDWVEMDGATGVVRRVPKPEGVMDPR